MVDSLPEVPIANRNHLAEPFPLPIVFAPLTELASDTSTHISAAGDQCDARRPINRLEAADHRQKFQAAWSRVELRIIRRELLAATSELQQKFPTRAGRSMASRPRTTASNSNRLVRELSSVSSAESCSLPPTDCSVNFQ